MRSTYLIYRQTKKVLHSKAVLRDFLILQMSRLKIEAIRFNSTTFAGRLDMLDHIISYSDHSPDVLVYKQRMQVEHPTSWPADVAAEH